jgi:uncharacterized protein (DUF2147 family)
MRKFLAPSLLLLGASIAVGASPNRSPEGDWLTEKKSGIIEVFRCGPGETLCGKIVWFRIKPDDPNPKGLDLKNPDPSQRNRPLCGLTFMFGFKPTGADSWEDGTVYDAENGNSYHATLKLQSDGTLRLHGYIGISLFGASEVWTRYSQPVPACPT